MHNIFSAYKDNIWLFGRVKLTNSFELIATFDEIEHAEMRIQITLRMRKVSFGSLLGIHAFCSIQRFC